MPFDFEPLARLLGSVFFATFVTGTLCGVLSVLGNIHTHGGSDA